MPRITIDRYLDKLAARSPVPGGGSAAALVGAIGVSLLSMVARYVAKRDPQIIKLYKVIKFTDRTRRRLRRLMIEDEAAYLRLSKAIKKRGSKDITNLYKRAANVPLEVCSLLKEALEKCDDLCSHCKGTIASDLKEAAVLIEAGFMSAKLNVKINLDGIRDTAYNKKIRRQLSMQNITVLNTKKRILKRLQNRCGMQWQRL